MDMRMSLKASQYMMLSKTKVHGKTIRDTRSWNTWSTLCNMMIHMMFMINNLDYDKMVMKKTTLNDNTHNADCPFSSSFHDFFCVYSSSSFLSFSTLSKKFFIFLAVHRQINRTACLSVLLILTLKSNPRDLWSLRHLIRVIRRHYLTQNDLPT